jgi:hypothetical protein
MFYALVVVLLLFIAAASATTVIVIWGRGRAGFAQRTPPRNLRPPQLLLSAILPFPAQAVHFTG